MKTLVVLQCSESNIAISDSALATIELFEDIRHQKSESIDSPCQGDMNNILGFIVQNNHSIPVFHLDQDWQAMPSSQAAITLSKKKNRFVVCLRHHNAPQIALTCERVEHLSIDNQQIQSIQHLPTSFGDMIEGVFHWQGQPVWMLDAEHLIQSAIKQ